MFIIQLAGQFNPTKNPSYNAKSNLLMIETEYLPIKQNVKKFGLCPGAKQNITKIYLKTLLNIIKYFPFFTIIPFICELKICFTKS